MALSTCPKCASHLFEVVVAEPRSSTVKMRYVQCMMCGAVVGVVDYFRTTSLDEHQKLLSSLQSEVSSLKHSVQQLTQALRR